MNARTCRPDELNQPRLQRPVDVFVVQLDAPLAAGVLLLQLTETRANRLAIGTAHETLLVEHPYMGNRGTHVVGHQAVVQAVIVPGRECEDSFVQGRALVPKPSHQP